MHTVSERELLRLKYEGCESLLIDFRLRHEELGTTVKVLTPLLGRSRVHPHYLPTQASGRWSITKPNLPGFSDACINPECIRTGGTHSAGKGCWSTRDVIVPDPGWYFLKFDWQAIEAKLAAGYSEDDEDLDLFARDADIHTVTYCKMYGLPLPPNVMDPYGDPECAFWRAETGLHDKGVWERHAAKTTRYSLAYGADQRAIHASADGAALRLELGWTKKQLEEAAKAYLDSKPKLVSWKYRIWDQVFKTGEVRTPLGRRKRVWMGTEEAIQWQKTRRATHTQKQALNHLAQGMVAGMMNRTIIAIKRRWKHSRLCYQAHDGLLCTFPEIVNPWPEIREIVEKDWDLGNGRVIRSTADWGRIRDDGSHEEVQ